MAGIISGRLGVLVDKLGPSRCHGELNWMISEILVLLQYYCRYLSRRYLSVGLAQLMKIARRTVDCKLQYTVFDISIL